VASPLGGQSGDYRVKSIQFWSKHVRQRLNRNGFIGVEVTKSQVRKTVRKFELPKPHIIGDGGDRGWRPAASCGKELALKRQSQKRRRGAMRLPLQTLFAKLSGWRIAS
jgi:hypothetical protein